MTQRSTRPAADDGYEDRKADTSLEWDEPGAPLNILWGRLAILVALLALAILVALLALAFLAGRLTAPEGVSSERVTHLESRLAESNDRIDALEADLADARTEAEEAEAAAEEAALAATEEGETDATEEGETNATEEVPVGDTYVVEPGDTLQSIAREFYEDPTLDDVIAEANDITDPAMLSPGMELVIPERPEL